MAKDEGQTKKRRSRAKGFAWRAWVLINPDRPLGLAWPYRPWRDVPIILWLRHSGGPQIYEDLVNFDHALELNARSIYALVKAAKDDLLPSEAEKALKQLPETCDERFREAVGRLTTSGSVSVHLTGLDQIAARAVRERKHVASLARSVRVNRALEKGRCDAALMHDRQADFKTNTVKHNHRPSESVLLRTFLPFALVDRTMVGVQQIKAALLSRRAYCRSSDVTTGELALMAMHAQVNPADIYLDYDYLKDFLDLAVYAGAAARGKLHPLSVAGAATYRCMLAVGGEDPETDPDLHRERAAFALALRRSWVQVPGLAEATRRHGRLASP